MKKFLPYLLALVALLLVNYVYFAPVLSGKVLKQDDIMLGYAKGKEIRDYRETKGDEPLWTNSMFSGMPTFQISTLYPNNVLYYVQMLFIKLGGNASSIYIIFLLMLGVYLFLLAEGLNPWMAALGGVAFGFSAFFIISFGAGHNAKVRAAAYIAPTLMGVLLTLKGKHLTGFALTALFVGLSVHANHLQITYYQAILIGIVVLVHGIFAFREKTFPDFVKSGFILLFAAFLGIGPNIGNLWSTYTYTKETMRGGSSELSEKAESKGGLSFEYAMSWSYSPAETFNLIIPMYTGGGMSEDYSSTETYKEYFPLIRGSFQNQGASRKEAEENAERYISSLFYWGDESLVNGGYYVGAVVFFLFILGMVVLPPATRTWMISACVIAILLAWGRHFEGLNRFLYEHLPVYNKFRVPSMVLVIVFCILPIGGFMGLHKWLNHSATPQQKKKWLLKAAYITAGILLIPTLMGPAIHSLEGMRDAQLEQQGFKLDQLMADRASLLRNSGFRSLAFVAMAFSVLWFYIQGKLKSVALVPVLALILIADLWMFDRNHLNGEHFLSAREFDATYAPSDADKQILQDKDPHYRVMNTTTGLTSDSYTSYHHKSIGGYHGAKLVRYQDVIEKHLSQNNLKVYNMLNTRYFIVDAGQGRLMAQKNPSALGNAWFVNKIKWVENADAEINALGDETFDPANEALVDKRFKESIKVQGNSESSSIALKSYDPKKMIYTANNTTQKTQLAVFSEIYYEGSGNDWNATISGEKANILRVNYLLRALEIPAGEHEIVFEFKPISYYAGSKIDLGFSILLIIALLGSVFWEYKKKGIIIKN